MQSSNMAPQTDYTKMKDLIGDSHTTEASHHTQEKVTITTALAHNMAEIIAVISKIN